MIALLWCAGTRLVIYSFVDEESPFHGRFRFGFATDFPLQHDFDAVAVYWAIDLPGTDFCLRVETKGHFAKACDPHDNGVSIEFGYI